jgi:hypothetical protein
VSVGPRYKTFADVRECRTSGIREVPLPSGRSLAATRAFSGRKSADPSDDPRIVNKLAATVR